MRHTFNYWNCLSIYISMYTGRHFFSFIKSRYRLELDEISGTIGTLGLTYHDNLAFTTFDRDNDPWRGNCAQNHQGAWWFRACHRCNINGIWGEKTTDGVSWYDGSKWLFPTYTEMKIRRISSTER